MTGVFQIYIKRPKEGEVVILSPLDDPMQEQQRFPNMKDSDKFDYEHIKDVETAWEVERELFKFFREADSCEEFIVRCELPR